jgi:hypothetical protein
MYNDIKARLPYYWSDWTDAWNYRVVPATWVSVWPVRMGFGGWLSGPRTGRPNKRSSSLRM